MKCVGNSKSFMKTIPICFAESSRRNISGKSRCFSVRKRQSFSFPDTLIAKSEELAMGYFCELPKTICRDIASVSISFYSSTRTPFYQRPLPRCVGDLRFALNSVSGLLFKSKLNSFLPLTTLTSN